MDRLSAETEPCGRAAPPSSLWIVVAALIFVAVGGAAVWSGWRHSDDPIGGPPPISLRDVIRSQGGGLGSQPT